MICDDTHDTLLSTEATTILRQYHVQSRELNARHATSSWRLALFVFSTGSHRRALGELRRY